MTAFRTENLQAMLSRNIQNILKYAHVSLLCSSVNMDDIRTQDSTL